MRREFLKLVSGRVSGVHLKIPRALRGRIFSICQQKAPVTELCEEPGLLFTRILSLDMEAEIRMIYGWVTVGRATHLAGRPSFEGTCPLIKITVSLVSSVSKRQIEGLAVRPLLSLFPLLGLRQVTCEGRSNTACGSQEYGMKKCGKDQHNYASFTKLSIVLHFTSFLIFCQVVILFCC